MSKPKNYDAYPKKLEPYMQQSRSYPAPFRSSRPRNLSALQGIRMRARILRNRQR